MIYSRDTFLYSKAHLCGVSLKISDNKADYVIGLKENQCTLYHDAMLYFRNIPAEIPTFETLEKDHGRLEKRTFYLLTERAWEYEWGKWTNLNGIGMVKTHVWEKDTVCENTRYFITSLTDVTEFAYAVRKHWSIENQLHWNLDVIFREDAARSRKDNAPLKLKKTNMPALREQLQNSAYIIIQLNQLYYVILLLFFVLKSQSYSNL